MPICPPKTEERTRWENVIGKPTKDLVTRVMRQTGETRAEARVWVLNVITKLDVDVD
jgi:hypothetical protein